MIMNDSTINEVAAHYNGSEVDLRFTARGLDRTEVSGQLENFPDFEYLKVWRDGQDSFGNPIRVGLKLAYKEVNKLLTDNTVVWSKENA